MEIQEIKQSDTNKEFLDRLSSRFNTAQQRFNEQ